MPKPTLQAKAPSRLGRNAPTAALVATPKKRLATKKTSQSLPALDAEWLETDGLGGYASGTVSGIRTRRYHSILTSAITPPTDRRNLICGMEVWLEFGAQRWPISAQRYAPGVTQPNGFELLKGFSTTPWPRWTFKLNNGCGIEQQLFMPRETPAVVLSWSCDKAPKGMRLYVRPLLAVRDCHALHRHNGAFNFDYQEQNELVTWAPYPNSPALLASSNGQYTQAPQWYYNFLYEEERARGFDATEDLASPGVFAWNVGDGSEALLLFTSSLATTELSGDVGSTRQTVRRLRQSEERRRKLSLPLLERNAEHYIARRGKGRTIIAGYPWFADWERDTFISMRGLTIATQNFEDSQSLLLDWSQTVSQGMLPNRFPEQGSTPEYNSVDAALWYIIAANDFLRAAHRKKLKIARVVESAIQDCTHEILTHYCKGTRYNIHMDSDALIAAGQPGVQLTWMDAKIGDWVVTPRIGKPVEIQALWINALKIGAATDKQWQEPYARASQNFAQRFWNTARGCLHDIVDVDHQPGTTDPTLRPNQILVVGGLPLTLLSPEQARQVVDVVEQKLLTPMGLRTLAPDEPHYRPKYMGNPRERDSAYHQGTVWPWLMGPFIEAWLRVRNSTASAKAQARKRFLEPLIELSQGYGLGHISEIADATAPHTPRGAPFQAWSVGEAIRVGKLLD